MLKKENAKNPDISSSIQKELSVNTLLPKKDLNNDSAKTLQQWQGVDIATTSLEKLHFLQDQIELYLCELGYKIYYQLAEESESSHYEVSYKFYLQIKDKIKQLEKETLTRKLSLEDAKRKDSLKLTNYSPQSFKNKKNSKENINFVEIQKK